MVSYSVCSSAESVPSICYGKWGFVVVSNLRVLLIVLAVCIPCFASGYLLGQWHMTGKVVTASESAGRFLGDPVAKWLGDGRDMELEQDFVFIDSSSRSWVAAKGTVVNGASIPKFLWSIIGGPFEGKYRNASIIHDAECVKKNFPSAEVHRMFYDACLAGGVGVNEAKRLYWAVANFGPQWAIEYQPYTTASVRPDGTASLTKFRAVLVELAAPELTEKEYQKAKEFFEQNDVPVDQLPGLRLNEQAVIISP